MMRIVFFFKGRQGEEGDAGFSFQIVVGSNRVIRFILGSGEEGTGRLGGLGSSDEHQTSGYSSVV